MTAKNNSRRDFIKKSSLGGLGTALGMGITIPAIAENSLDISGHNISDEKLQVKPRFHDWIVEEGDEWLEVNTGQAKLDWNIPVSQCALVFLDVWQRHYLKETEERAENIINEKYVPLLKKCREFGMEVIHCPSPSVAKTHKNWVKLMTDSELKSAQDSWPPTEFRNLTGPFNAYKRPFKPKEAERNALPALTFHPKVIPINKEAVIAYGDELHRYCKQKGILFLFFAGFNTNACMITRDYGALQMNYRGYQVSVIRDCTTGMESRETQAGLLQTNGALLFFEMYGQYTVTSDEMIGGFSRI